ncbi:unnamed protein product [Clonostachys rosea]|uniref:Uncharacterized protein n=1 Tax=Bionectria ochroleuca TaxID=29856 RepID=A0ABY6U192_BIOOC|nr:unnamed protein product [Clonostachys rosea]
MVAFKQLALATFLLTVAEQSVAAPLISPSANEFRTHLAKGKALKAPGTGLEASVIIAQPYTRVAQSIQKKREAEAAEKTLDMRAHRKPKSKPRINRNRNKGKPNKKHHTTVPDIESRDMGGEDTFGTRGLTPVDSYFSARAITDVDSLIANAYERDLEAVGTYLAIRELQRRGFIGKAVKAIAGGAKKLGRHVDWAKVGAAAGQKLNNKLRGRQVGGREEIEERDVDDLIERSISDVLDDALIFHL